MLDLLWPELVEAAMMHHGAPRAVAKLLSTAWHGPRFCTVAGESANPIYATRGVPQGDPCSPLALSLVMGLWNHLISKAGPHVHAWAYMDDRTLALVDDADHAELDAAVALTRRFDAAVGFQPNLDKEQRWHRNPPDTLPAPAVSVIEHLGLRIDMAHHTAPITSRFAWDHVLQSIDRLSRCPGGASMRLRLAAAYIRPLFDWASPFHRSPNKETTQALYKAITTTRCTWWCHARWWCERVNCHPALGVAIRAIISGGRVLAWPSQALTTALHAHARALRLRITAITASSITLTTLPTTHPHLVALIHQQYQTHSFESHHPRAAHTLRAAARLVCLASASTRRNDIEGLDDADVESTSSPVWTRWTNHLNSEDKLALTIWRGGAVRSPTRRYFRPGDAASLALTKCTWCGAERASARHLFAVCPHFHTLRTSLSHTHRIPLEWWANQPRCTCKSGWITVTAAGTFKRRVELQIAVCVLGIAITKSCAPPGEVGAAPAPEA